MDGRACTRPRVRYIDNVDTPRRVAPRRAASRRAGRKEHKVLSTAKICKIASRVLAASVFGLNGKISPLFQR